MNRDRELAIVRVFEQQRAEMYTVATRLLVQYIALGGKPFGQEFFRLMFRDAHLGVDLSVYIKHLIERLNIDDQRSTLSPAEAAKVQQ